MSFPNAVWLQHGDQFKVRTLAQGPLYLPGTKGFDGNGDIYRYCQVGAVAMVVGKLYQAPIPVTNHVLQTATAAAVGATTVALTLGNTAVVANDYVNGQLVVDLATNTGFGYTYTIDCHPAVAGSGVFTVPLAGSPSRTLPVLPQEAALVVSGNESVQVAIATTANSVSLVPNTYKKVILSVQATPPLTAEIAGFSIVAAAIGSWCWLKTRGHCMCLTNGTVVIGQAVMPGATTAGTIEAMVAGTAETTPNSVGDVVRVAVTTAYSTINARID
jgi:hypothetical protein